VTWRALTIGGYLLVLAAGFGLQAAAGRAAARQGSRAGRIPRLGEVLAVVMRTRTGRVGVIVAWAWLGLHFFAK